VDLLDVAKRVLDEEEWGYDVSDDGRFLRSGFSGENGSWPFFVGVDDDVAVSVDSILDQLAPEPRRAEVVELLTRINWGKRLGSFHFDYSDGEIRCHSAVDVEGGELTPTMFQNLLFSNLAMVDYYFGAIMAVCYARVDALSALLAIEEDQAT
jgi:hypothetical protein